MRTSSSLLVTLVLLVSTTFGGELISMTGRRKAEPFKVSSLRLGESQAVAVAKINAHLDSDCRIAVIETPLEKVLRMVGRPRNLNIGVDLDALSKSGVALDRLVTLEADGIPLRRCLHDILEPIGLTFVIYPEGVLITSGE